MKATVREGLSRSPLVAILAVLAAAVGMWFALSPEDVPSPPASSSPQSTP